MKRKEADKADKGCEQKFDNLKYRIRRFMTRKNQCLIILFTILMVAAAVYTAVTEAFPEPVNITLYVFAGAGFVCTCGILIRIIIFFVKNVLLPFTKRNRIANTLISDTGLRTVLFTVPGMGLNLICAVFNGVIGITSRSAWFGSLSAYYILMYVMRFLSVSYARTIYNGKFICKKSKKTDTGTNNRKTEDTSDARAWKVYRNCGVMLSVSSIALSGAVIVLVSGVGGKSYPGLMIYAVATYTFYKLIMAIRNMILANKQKSFGLFTLRNIGYADALVSLLSLQTAMFAAFGQDSETMIPITDALTGAGVCQMIFTLGVYMVYNSKNIKENQK